ncbi:acyltransferase family protein [Rothia sp. P13129]|uniref:acyltransferase family protein n=1 Tax=Rothia sp. P13129 TaxID=3402664 RepID=UPI003AC800F2
MGHQTLNDSLLNRRNSLNFIRLVLAAIVIVGHAPLQLYGDSNITDIWVRKVNSLGSYAVMMFFVISGYLILASTRHGNLKSYAWRRFLRIYPAYWGMLLFIAFIAAPLSSLLGYFPSNGWEVSQSVRYLISNFTIVSPSYVADIAGSPAGVGVPGVWNGPIWTLKYEVVLYVVLIPFGFLSFIKNKQRLYVTIFAMFSAIFAAYSYLADFVFPGFNNLPHLMSFFFMGSLFYVWGDKIIVKREMSILCAILSIVIFLLNSELPNLLLQPLFAYAILTLGVVLKTDFAQKNDISYGLYIYGWPVQQVLLMVGFSTLSWPINALVTCVVAVALASVSWFLIERPALSLKRIVK